MNLPTSHDFLCGLCAHWLCGFGFKKYIKFKCGIDAPQEAAALQQQEQDLEQQQLGARQRAAACREESRAAEHAKHSTALALQVQSGGAGLRFFFFLIFPE